MTEEQWHEFVDALVALESRFYAPYSRVKAFAERGGDFNLVDALMYHAHTLEETGNGIAEALYSIAEAIKQR